MRFFSVSFLLWFFLSLHMTYGDDQSKSTSSSSTNARVKLTLDLITLDDGAATTTSTTMTKTPVPMSRETEDSYDRELVKVLLQLQKMEFTMMPI